MDIIDLALIDAWRRVSHSIQSNPNSPDSRRRLARLNSPTLARPIRPWCLCLRASDTRIHDKHWAMSDEDRRAGNIHAPHHVALDALHIRNLTKPVDIDWPGIDWTSAARLLGRDRTSLTPWLKGGVFRVSRRNARSVRKRGKPVPYVYSHTPLDPNSHCGRPPAALWGSMWQSHYTLIPEDFEQSFQRIPRLRYFRGQDKPKFCGWNFICPTCKRRVSAMYYPLPVWTIADFFGLPSSPALAGEVSERGSASKDGGGSSSPSHPTSDIPHPTFRCYHCHRIRFLSLGTRNGWNQFVSAISGGLLDGRDVPRAPLASEPEIRNHRKRNKRPFKQKHPYIPPPATATRRRKTQEMLIRGSTYRQIAAALKVSFGTTKQDINRIYQTHKVRRHHELLAALGISQPRPTPPAPPIPTRPLKPRLQAVADLILQGFKSTRIAATLNLDPQEVENRINRLCPFYKVHSRKLLQAQIARHAAAMKEIGGQQVKPTATARRKSAKSANQRSDAAAAPRGMG